MPQITISNVEMVLRGEASGGDYSYFPHSMGRVGAKVSVVTYCDTESPFCKIFSGTMNEVVKDYTYKAQSVEWIYRHFPLNQIHPKATAEARVLECTAALGGDFWKGLDLLQKDTYTTNAAMDKVKNLLTSSAQKKLSKCVDAATTIAVIDQDTQAANAANARGIPHSIILVNGIQVHELPGAHSYNSVKSMIDVLLP